MEITDKISKEVDGKIELTISVDKADYLEDLEGQKARQEEIIAYAQKELDLINAELAKHGGK